MFRRIELLLLIAGLLFCHANLRAQQTSASGSVAVPQPPPATDRVQQMRADLNQMESLMNNMQSEINFLRDQNLQILLNTNVRMWTILIRDLRRQLDDEEQKRSPEPRPSQTPAKP